MAQYRDDGHREDAPHFKGIAQDHRFDCLRTLSSSAWKVLAPCQFENLEKVNFEKFKVK